MSINANIRHLIAYIVAICMTIFVSLLGSSSNAAGGIVDPCEASLLSTDQFKAPHQMPDLPADEEVVATLTLYNGNNNESNMLGPSLDIDGDLLVEKFLKGRGIDKDLRHFNGYEGYVWEIKLAAKRPSFKRKNSFNDLLELVAANFTHGIYFLPKDSILDGNMFYARVVSEEIRDYYLNECGFEALEMSPEDQIKMDGSYIIKMTLRQLLAHTEQRSGTQMGLRETFSLVNKDRSPTQLKGYRHEFFGFHDFETGHYSSAVMEAFRVIEMAYSDPRHGEDNAKKSVRALSDEFDQTEAIRKNVFVLTRKKGEAYDQNLDELQRRWQKDSYRDDYILVELFPMYQNALQWHQKYIESLKDGALVIEAGTGAGLMGTVLRKRYKALGLSGRFLHLDLNPDMIELAKDRIPKEDLLVGDVTNLVDAHGNLIQGVDHIFSHSVIWNLENTAAFFKEVSRALKPGGTLTLSFIRELDRERVNGFLRELRRQVDQLRRQGQISLGQAENIMVNNRILLEAIRGARSLDHIRNEANGYGLELFETDSTYRYGNGPDEFLMHALAFQKNR